MKIAGVDFPDPLLNALRDGRLVVFAGAGMSMGPPADLPGFRRLAEQVAEGTGQSVGEAETEDRFLGRLKDLGANVHQRASETLQGADPKPTTLHLNLLRLFREPGTVRVVPLTLMICSNKRPSANLTPSPGYSKPRHCHWATVFEELSTCTVP